MKKNIHPKYEKTTVECACGNSFETRSTAAPTIKVELCSACHPFFTGKQKFVDTAGRVDKFRARQEKAAAIKPKEAKQTPKEAKQKDNKEKLAEIKEEITKAAEVVETEIEAPTAPGQVDQTADSDSELAAADELADNQGEHRPEDDQPLADKKSDNQ